jgi:pimeloyl-ACP methyl ester carboxylesterase
MEMVIVTPSQRAPLGAVLVVPGLHFGGADEPRMRRFISVLAHAGLTVALPNLPDYMEQVLRPGVVDDLGLALERFLASDLVPEGVKPALFTISFGSWPGLEIACRPEFSDRIGGVVTFGGFADWRETLKFCVGLSLEGALNRPRDPLNRPVCFMNLIDDLPGAPSEPEAVETLFRGWRSFMDQTWGQTEMKDPARYEAVAQGIVGELPQALQTLFLQGCAAAPGGEALCETALERCDPRPWLDPRPHLPGLRAPISIVHGRDDDVIPVEEQARLVAALPAHVQSNVYATGLYGHSERGGAAELISLIPGAVREGKTLLSMLGDLVRYAGVPS